MIEPPNEHPFDALGRWSQLTDAELRTDSTPKNYSLLGKIVDLLEDGTVVRSIDDASFCQVVRKMRMLYEEYSWKLGEAIAHAEELREQGRNGEADDILKQFIAQCPAPFYRQIASNHLGR